VVQLEKKEKIGARGGSHLGRRRQQHSGEEVWTLALRLGKTVAEDDVLVNEMLSGWSQGEKWCGGGALKAVHSTWLGRAVGQTCMGCEHASDSDGTG
jgi:hypothetical protein